MQEILNGVLNSATVDAWALISLLVFSLELISLELISLELIQI